MNWEGEAPAEPLKFLTTKKTNDTKKKREFNHKETQETQKESREYARAVDLKTLRISFVYSVSLCGSSSSAFLLHSLLSVLFLRRKSPPYFLGLVVVKIFPS